MSDWKKTDYPGVRLREHPTRKHHGKPDRYFTIRYRLDGKLKEEPLGWASEGWTPSRANAELVDRKRGKPSGRSTEKQPVVEHAKPEEILRPPVAQEKTEQVPPLPREEKARTTFEQASNLFIEWAKGNKKTWSDDQQRLKKHVEPVLGSLALDGIGFPELEMLRIRCQNKGLASATVVQCLAVTRAVFNFALKMRLFSGSNPVKEMKLPKLNNKRLRFLTMEEASLLFDTASSSNRELHDMCLLCLYTGMRAGEMIALRWFDVDFKYDLITIRDSKNGDTRQVFLTENVKVMLKKRSKDSPGSLVFPTHDGKQRVRVSKMFLRLINKLGWNEGITDRRQRVCFHTLRHTFASWLALQGETLLTIKELMGHKTIEMTMRYAHLIPDQKRKAVERLASRKTDVV